MTGPAPITATPERNMLAELWHRFSTAQIPLGSAGVGGVDVNDALWPLTDNRGSDRMLPESFSINDLIGAISKAPQSADVGKMALDQVKAQHTAPDPNEPYSAITHLMKLLPMAITFGGGAVAPATSRGSFTVGTYAGRNSATADLVKLERAEALEKTGIDAAPGGEIWRETGWFKDPAGDWKYEISDDKMELKDPNTSYSWGTTEDLKAGNGGSEQAFKVFRHDKLMEAYPELADLWISLRSELEAGQGQFMPEANLIDIGINRHRLVGNRSNPGVQTILELTPEHRRTLLHEIQHWIQQKEGFSPGGHPNMTEITGPIDADIAKRTEALNADLQQLDRWRDMWIEAGHHEKYPNYSPSMAFEIANPEAVAKRNAIFEQVRRMQGPERRLSQYRDYERLLGEMEARDVEARSRYTDFERELLPPYTSDREAAANPIILKPGGGRMNSEPPPLDMSPEARAARAAVQGYNLDAYHGTKRDFTEFQRGGPGKNNPDAHIHVGDQDAANGIIMSDWSRAYWEKEAREGHSEQRRAEAQRELDSYYNGAHVMPLKVKANNPLDMPDLGRWDYPGNFMNAAAKENYDGWKTGAGDYLPKGWNPPPAVWDEFMALVKANRDVPYDQQRAHWSQGFSEILTKHGYDSVRYPNEIEGKGGFSYMLLDPSQARSRFAEFHPDKVGDPNILSGRAGAPVTPNTPPPGTDPERESRDAANRAWLTMGGA